MSLIQYIVCLAVFLPVCQVGGSWWRVGRIGCYRDRGDRDMRGHHAIFQDNTPRRCVLYCWYKDFQYAGLEYGMECYCSNSYGKHGRIADDECNTKCTGDGSKTCGGSWALDIYRT